MGNRIHKVLGYGFEDVEYRKDSRFNESFWLFLDNDDDDDLLEKLKEENSRKIENLKENDFGFEMKMFSYEVENKKKLKIGDFVKFSGYASEMKKSPFVFIDPFGNWSRYDDTIDYYDCEKTKHGPKDVVKLIKNDNGEKGCIYPYLSYVNKKTGEPINCCPSERYSDYDQYYSEKYKLTLDEWKNNVVPAIPYSIRLFCEVMKVFKNPLTIYDSHAMIYTYWS